MDKCECWELLKIKDRVVWPEPLNITRTIQICNGTKERESCTCDGDVTKCNFYPEKRKEGKMMNTAEMWLKAKENGKTYKLADETRIVYYREGKGLFDVCGDYVSMGKWRSLDSFMSEQWEETTTVLTKSEAEAKFGIKIVGG